MDQQELGFLDYRAIDNYIFNGLTKKGFVPGFEEVQAVTDIVVSMLVEMGVAFEQEVIEEEDEAE